MPKIDSLLITQSGGASLRVTLPKTWCKDNHIKHHDTVQMMIHGVIVIFPPTVDKSLDVDKLMIDIKHTLNFLK
jgi:antitoxin component of MazEF toxin-antitoxin module